MYLQTDDASAENKRYYIFRISPKKVKRLSKSIETYISLFMTCNIKKKWNFKIIIL